MQSTKWELYEYQRSRSVIDLGPNHLHSIFLNFFSSITADFNISSAIRWAIQDQWSSGLSFLSNFLKHFRVGRYENLLECNKNCMVGTKKTKKKKKKKKNRVGRVSGNTGIFFFFFFRPKDLPFYLQGKESAMYHWRECNISIHDTNPTFCRPYSGMPTRREIHAALKEGVNRLKDGADAVCTYLDHLSRLMTKHTKLPLRPVWSEQEETLGPQLPVERTVKTLTRLGGCPGWSESLLDAQIILLVLS